jgi:hypothetical protein
MNNNIIYITIYFIFFILHAGEYPQYFVIVDSAGQLRLLSPAAVRGLAASGGPPIEVCDREKERGSEEGEGGCVGVRERWIEKETK